MKSLFNQSLSALILAVLVLAAAPALAEFEVIEQTVTIDSGETTASETITFEGVIKEIYVYVPELDAGSTATLSLDVTPFDAVTATVTPNGWTDKNVGATEDGAVVLPFSSTATICVTGQITLTCTTYDAQAADRVFRWRIIREY